MKKYTILLITAIGLLGQACATLNPSEIANLNKKPLEPLRLDPLVEPNELRIDIIRQRVSNPVSATVVTYTEVPYHPLGFDLGNGLFYDLNGNLSLRADHLLGVEPERPFSIVKENIPRGRRGVEYYTFRNDSLTRTYVNKKRVDELYHRREEGDSITFRGKTFRDYAVVYGDSTVVYRGKRRAWDVLTKQPNGDYTLNKGLAKREYEIKGNEILLKNQYRLQLSPDNRTLRIYNQSFLSNGLVCTIERSDDRILLYNQRGSGHKIQLGKEEITIYNNRSRQNRYALRSME